MVAVALLAGQRTCDSQVATGCFKFWLGTIASYLHLCASVTKQYNWVPANGVISLAGEATAGLVESNGAAAYHRVYD